MKICLISPYESASAYGLRILSAVLKQDGHEVTSLFLPLDFRDEIPASALEGIFSHATSSALVGLSLSSNYFRTAINLTRAIKSRCPDVPVMWGGIHPTIEPLECLEHCDIACVGEAESALSELAYKMASCLPYVGTRNFHFKMKDGSILSNSVRSLETNLDAIPFPDYTNENHFILHEGRLVPMTPELLNRNLEGQYLTLSSRGCVHSCTFCCNNFLKTLYRGDRWFRKRSIPNVIEECLWVKEHLPWVTEILFDDDAFMYREIDELKDFIAAYSEKVGVPFFVTGITPQCVTDEKIRLLAEGGMRRIRIGIQTASDRTNFEIYKRPIPHKKAEDAIEVIKKNHSAFRRTHYDFIVDNPWETPQENLETLRFLLTLPRPWAINICSLTFYPGTELFERACRESLITDKFKDIYDKSYKAYRNTYVNRMFYFFCQSNLPNWALSLFVNKWIFALRLNYPLWWFYVALRDLKHYWKGLREKLRLAKGGL